MIAWDKHQDNRLFVLRELPEGFFETVDDFFRRVQPEPRHPVIRWSFASEFLKDAAEDLIARISATASKPRWIAAGKSILAPLRVRSVSRKIADAVAVAEAEKKFQDIKEWSKHF